MGMPLGDITVAGADDDHLALTSLVTGLSMRTVNLRQRKAHGNTLLRNLFANDWPYDAERLGALTVALARHADLTEEIAAVTDLAPRTVRKRLTERRGNTLVSTTFPEMHEWDDEEEDFDNEVDDYNGQDDDDDDTHTRPGATDVDLLGAVRVVSARAPVMRRWLARRLRWSELRMHRLLKNTHGKTLLRNALGDHWPISIDDGIREVLAEMRVAALRRSPSLVLWVALLLDSAPSETAQILEDAQGNLLVKTLFPALTDPIAITTGEDVTSSPATTVVTLPPTEEAPPSAVGPGVLVNRRWRVLKPLGERGGFGVVFEARDERHPKHRYVIKVAEGRTADVRRRNEERLHSEVALAHRLTHQNICAYVLDEYDERLGIYFAIMKYAGDSLQSMIRAGALDTLSAFDVVTQIARGLDYAHQNGIVHQDLKPANILVQAYENYREVRVGDWGIANEGRGTEGADGNPTVIASAIGRTLGYTAPEYWRGIARSSSDQYCLALVLCSIIEGRIFTAPYRFDGFSSFNAEQNAAVARALSEDPDDRFASCSEFAARLWEVK